MSLGHHLSLIDVEYPLFGPAKYLDAFLLFRTGQFCRRGEDPLAFLRYQGRSCCL
jgi:hypothetical protein